MAAVDAYNFDEAVNRTRHESALGLPPSDKLSSAWRVRELQLPRSILVGFYTGWIVWLPNNALPITFYTCASIVYSSGV